MCQASGQDAGGQLTVDPSGWEFLSAAGVGQVDLEGAR